jgi:hypothetical protein
MPRTLRLTSVAVLATLTLTACGAPPQPDPDEFWTELSFYTDLSDDYRAQAVDEGEATCAELAAAPPGDDAGLDRAAESWATWTEQMGAKDAAFFWETAVEHLCPGQSKTLERVRDHDEAAPQNAS